MATILVTNDDGITAPGLLALKNALADLGTVVVLAPERNWSAAGHSRTMHKPLRVLPTQLADGSKAFACTGGPSDCVVLAALGALDTQIDLVVSGINHGHNLGADVTYSGTVACAIEAIIKGIPGIAISAASKHASEAEPEDAYEVASVAARAVVAAVLQQGLPDGVLLNVNAPGVALADVRGVEVTRMGSRRYKDYLVAREDPFGKPYYWLGAAQPVDIYDDGSDVGAVANKIVSITPIGLDMTHSAFMDDLRGWRFDMPFPPVGNASAGNSTVTTQQVAEGATDDL